MIPGPRRDAPDDVQEDVPARPRIGVARGAIGTFVLKLADAGASFVVGVVLARLLGADGLGVVALALAWSQILLIPSLLGHENLTVRFISTYAVNADWGRTRGFLAHAFRITTIAAMAFAAVAVVVGLVLGGGPTDRTPVLVGAMVLIPLMTATRISGAALRGLRRVALGFVPELAVMPVLVLCLLGLLAVSGTPLDPALAMAIHVGAAAVALGVGLVLLRRSLPSAVRTAAAVSDRRAWMAGALPLLFIGVTQVVSRQADIVLIGTFVGDGPAGIYSVATRSAGLVGFALFGVNAALAPIIARAYAAGDMSRLQAIATRSARLSMLFTLPAAAVFIVFGEWYLGIFGPGFGPAAVPLAILSAAQFVNAAMGSVGLLLTMTGHEPYAARGFGLGALVNLVLNLLLIPPFGIVGAAVATSIGLVVWNVVLGVYVYRILGLHSTALGVVRLRRGS